MSQDRIDLQAEVAEFELYEAARNNAVHFLQHPDMEIVEPRLAATVMLVRDAHPHDTSYRIEDPDQLPPDFPNAQNLEVFMLRRARSMDFLADAVVFPGGRVDERDANPHLPWIGPSPAQWGELLGLSEDDARKVVVAAVRELFEECGVLLAGPDENSLVCDLTDATWMQDRDALESYELSFADMLVRRGLYLRSDLLGIVSNIRTPEFEPKRFDTFAFSALLPDGQQADGKTTEAQSAGWVTPSYAVAKHDAGQWFIVSPTLYNLTVAAHAPSAARFAARREKVKKMMSVAVEKEPGELVLQCALA